MRDRAAEKAMLEEISLRNRIAQFQDLNLRDLKVAAIPRVGIFWVGADGTVYSESTSLRDAVDYGDFRIHDGSHYDAWSRAVSSNPSWKGYEYEQISRGRVAYRRHPKKPRFIVYMPKELKRHESKIARAFFLPPGYIEYDYGDEHYELPH